MVISRLAGVLPHCATDNLEIDRCYIQLRCPCLLLCSSNSGTQLRVCHLSCCEKEPVLVAVSEWGEHGELHNS